MKLIKNILIFLVCSFSIYISILFLLVRLQYKNSRLIYSAVDATSVKGGDNYRRFHEFDVDKNYDLIILGSSHAYRGYDIHNFDSIGLKSYNLGSSAQSIGLTNILAKNLINKKNTKRVILEIYQNSFVKNKATLEDASILIANVKENGLAFKIALNNNDVRSYNHFFIRVLSDTQMPKKSIDDGDYYKGYCSTNKKIINVDSITKAIKTNPKSWKNSEIDTDKLKDLDMLIKYLKSESIKAVVCSHYTPIETDRFIEKLVSSQIEKVCNANGVKYLNYMFKHNINTQNNFSDHHHLNMNGVKNYNLRLIRDLKEIGFF